MIDPEPLSHRLHRLPFAIKHQPPQIPQPRRLLFRPRNPSNTSEANSSNATRSVANSFASIPEVKQNNLEQAHADLTKQY